MAKDPDQRYPSAGDLGRDALAAAGRQRASLSERSVATGKAAPPGKPRPRALIPALGAAALATVVVLALVVTGAFSGSHSPRIITTSTSATTSSSAVTTPRPAPTPAPTTKTFTDLQHGVSFAYPAVWERLRLSGVLADFGIDPGRSETRCALVFEPGVGPASRSQEAQLAYVRTRSAVAASEAKHYQVLAIEAQQGANIAGVGLLRVDDGQGGHIGFFFRGRNIYVFDCITPAARLTQVDQQDFQPLLASVRIG